MLTNHEVEHVPLLIRPMQSERFDAAGKYRICLDTIKDIQSTIEGFLIIPEVKIQCMKD